MASAHGGLRPCADQPLRTIYSDLPSNDFNRLFANLEEVRSARRTRRRGRLPRSGQELVLRPAATPTGTKVHLATAFNAIHWLDSLPSAPLPDGVVYRPPHLARPGLAAPPEITAAIARQAEQDLTRFLECRAQELVTGAKLLLAGPDSPPMRVPFARGLVEVYDDACLDLVASGRLGREAYERLVWPCYFRTVAELLARWNEKTPQCAARSPSIAPRGTEGSRRPSSWSSDAAATRRPSPRPVPASCAPSPSRWSGQPCTGRRAHPAAHRVSV